MLLAESELTQAARKLNESRHNRSQKRLSKREYIEREKAKRRAKYMRTLQRNGRHALVIELMQDMLALLQWLMNDAHYRTQDLRPGEVFGPDWRRELFGADALPSGGVKKRKTKKGRG